MSENIFADEWVECLEAHYMHVIRIKDKVTEPSLSIVMHSAGFSDAQLGELRVRATMHVDDVGEDFVPDLDVLHTHDHDSHHDHHEAAPEVAEAQIYNIPIDITSTPAETVQVVEAELPIEIDHVAEAELELAVDVESAPIEDVPVAEVEVLDENDHLPDAELNPEELQEQEDEAFVEEELKRQDPDEPQQLSLF